jgi:hypothetical protein
VLSIIAAVQKSSEWSSSVILVVWDSWGGHQDHVVPPIVGGHREGFRVPALLVSPLVRGGYVSHRRYDHGSIPEMISRTFGLGGEQVSSRVFPGVWSPRVRQVPVLSATPASPQQTLGRSHDRAVMWTYVIGMFLAAATLAACVVPRASLTSLRWRS